MRWKFRVFVTALVLGAGASQLSGDSSSSSADSSSLDATVDAFVGRATRQGNALYDRLFVEKDDAPERSEFLDRFVARRLTEGAQDIFAAKGIPMPPTKAHAQQRDRIDECSVEVPVRELPVDRRYFEHVECLTEEEQKCGRLVVPNVATVEEATRLREATDRAMEGLYHQGGSTSIAVAREAPTFFGSTSWPLVRDLVDRAKSETETFFDVVLYEAGGLLTRLDAVPRPGSRQTNASHVYWNPHVDKANRDAYDFSALLYLSDRGTDFHGGELLFYDLRSRSQVNPRAGLLVAFSSSFENLHAVTFNSRPPLRLGPLVYP